MRMNSLKGHQMSVHQTIFRMWWNGKLKSRMKLSWQYEPRSLRNVSSTLLNLCHKGFKLFWRQKRFQPSTSKVYQLKWLLNIYHSDYGRYTHFHAHWCDISVRGNVYLSNIILPLQLPVRQSYSLLEGRPLQTDQWRSAPPHDLPPLCQKIPGK